MSTPMSVRLKILAGTARATPSGATSATASLRKSGHELERGPEHDQVREWIEEAMREIRLGRHPENELELPYAGISAFHAKLVKEVAGAPWHLEDLGSSNGTWVGSARLRAGERHPLHDGDTFRLGAVVIELDGAIDGRTPGRLESTATMGRRLIVDGLVPERKPPPRAATLAPSRSPSPSPSRPEISPARKGAVIAFAIGTTVLAVSGLIALALSLR